MFVFSVIEAMNDNRAWFSAVGFTSDLSQALEGFVAAIHTLKRGYMRASNAGWTKHSFMVFWIMTHLVHKCSPFHIAYESSSHAQTSFNHKYLDDPPKSNEIFLKKDLVKREETVTHPTGGIRLIYWNLLFGWPCHCCTYLEFNLNGISPPY